MSANAVYTCFQDIEYFRLNYKLSNFMSNLEKSEYYKTLNLFKLCVTFVNYIQIIIKQLNKIKKFCNRYISLSN